jgi:hypothetical protein
MNGNAVFWLIWIALAVLIGWYASTKKNHNGVVWFLLAFFFSPLIVGIIALLMGPRVTQADLARAVAGSQAPFTPTLRVPPEGLSSWARPDPSGPVTPLAGGLELAVIHRVDDWAQVRASNNWTGWVDARRLVSFVPPPPPAPLSPPPPPGTA